MNSHSGRTKGWGTCTVLALFCLGCTFSNALLLLLALPLAGYAFYLFNGGPDVTGEMANGTPRARAWLVWAVLALLALVTMTVVGLLVALVFGSYAAYLFSGRRDVTRKRLDGVVAAQFGCIGRPSLSLRSLPS